MDHKAYFNRLAPDWDIRMPAETRFRDLLLRFGIRTGERVLDIGAGTGRMTRILSDLAGPSGCVVAQDLAFQMVRTGRAHDGAASWLTDDVHSLALRTAFFEKVLCFSAFPHFQDGQHALMEMNRVLVSGGKLLILHTSCSSSLNAFHRSLDPPVCDDVLPPARLLAERLKHAGFHSITAEELPDLYWVEGVKA